MFIHASVRIEKCILIRKSKNHWEAESRERSFEECAQTKNIHCSLKKRKEIIFIYFLSSNVVTVKKFYGIKSKRNSISKSSECTEEAILSELM